MLVRHSQEITIIHTVLLRRQQEQYKFHYSDPPAGLIGMFYGMVWCR